MSKTSVAKKNTSSKSKYKVSRRLMTSIWGEPKDAFNIRNTKPGQHGSTRSGRVSDYGLHLMEKQKLKAHYNGTKEKQMKNVFKKANSMQGNLAENFIALLERRLYVLVYRLGFAPTIFAARQIVSHKHITINGEIINVPSYLVKSGEIIGLTDKAKSMKICKESLEGKNISLPEYLEFDQKKKEGKLLTHSISVDDIPFPFKIDMGLVVEFYSK